MPESSNPLPKSQQRRSHRMGLSFPYDWSNPNIGDYALIAGVLERTLFEDVARICLHLGMDAVIQVWKDLPPNAFRDQTLRRMLANIEEGFRRAD